MTIESATGNYGPTQTIPRNGKQNLNPNASRDEIRRRCFFAQAMQRSMTTWTANVGLVLLLIPMASCTRQHESQPSAGHSDGTYATPAAVFDAYREATRKREWRNCFDCLTPETQKNMMCELVFQCGLAA